MADINTIFTEILESQRDINTHIHELDPSSPIYLYEIDLNDIQPVTINFGENTVFSDGIIRIHNDYNLFNVNRGVIIWKDKFYYPFPIFGEGFDITSNGSLPTPKIKFSSQFLEDQYNSFYKYIRMQMNELKDIVGAKVTRRKTFLRYLAGSNFVGGINPFNEYDDAPWASRDGDTLTVRTSDFVSSNSCKWINYYYKPVADREKNIIFFNVKSIYNDKLLRQSQDCSFFAPKEIKNFFNIYVNSGILETNTDNPIFYQDTFIFSGNQNGFSNLIYKNENEFKLNNTSNTVKLIANFKTKKFINESGITINYPTAFPSTGNLVNFISIGSSGQLYTQTRELTEKEFNFNQLDPAPLVKYNTSNQQTTGFDIKFSNNLSGNYYINYLALETGFYTGTNPDTNEDVKLIALKQSVNFGSNNTGEVSISYPTSFTNYQPKILFNSNSNSNKLDFITELRNITTSGFNFYASGTTNLNTHTFNFIATDYQPILSTPTGITQTFSNFYNFGSIDDTELPNYKNVSNTEVELTPDIFYIDRKIQEDSTNAVYELASLLDIEGVKLPGRVLLSQNCPFHYRGEGCVYERYDRLSEKHSGVYANVVGTKNIQFATGTTQTILGTDGQSLCQINQLNENNLTFGLLSAPPVADQNDNEFSPTKNTAGSAWIDLGHWKREFNYQSGNFVHVQKNQLNYYFVCNKNHTSNSVNAPPNTGYWFHDTCSKTLNGCRLRWKNNFNFEPVKISYFVEMSDFVSGTSTYENVQEDVSAETIRSPIDQNNERLLGILPFGGFPSAEGKYRTQQSQGGQ